MSGALSEGVTFIPSLQPYYTTTQVPSWVSGALAGGDAAQRSGLLRALGAADTPDAQVCGMFECCAEN